MRQETVLDKCNTPGKKPRMGTRLKGTVRFLKPFKTRSMCFIIKHLTAVCVRVKRNTEC